MNLKKSDKMIAIAAVIILIIAAIGVIMYASEDTEDEVPTKDEELLTFAVTYQPLEGEATPDPRPDGYKISEKTLGDGSYTGTVEIPSDNLKSIKFYIEYEDTVRRGRYLPFLDPIGIGADTITMTVFDENDNRIDSPKKITGKGNNSLTYQDNSPISLDEIQAKDETEAWQKLNENLSNDGMMETYKIKVSIDQKEKRLILTINPIRRFFEWLLKDTFTLKVTYEYYDYDLTEQPSEPPEEPPAETNIKYSATPYVSTNYLGFH